MSAAVLQRALRRLADTVRQPTSLVFGGSAALLLAGTLGRQTDDGDMVESTPDLGQLQDAVHRVEALETKCAARPSRVHPADSSESESASAWPVRRSPREPEP